MKAGTLIPVFYDPQFDGREFSVPLYMKNYPIQPFHELYKSDQGHDAVRPAMGGLQVAAPDQRHHVPSDRAAAGRSERPRSKRCAPRCGSSPADKEYIDEANKVMGEAPEYVTSATLNEDVRNALTISPELKAFMDAYGKGNPK